MKDKILLFIPMYNCGKQITRVLNQLNGEIVSYIDQVVIINNRSTDDGEMVVKKYIDEKINNIPIVLLRNDANYGLGGSHKVAFTYAQENQFDYVIVLHGDDQGHVENLVPWLETEEYKKHDCLLGARFMKDSNLDGYSAFRTFGNHVYNFLFSIVLRKKIFDLGSGLNMYKVKCLESKYYFKFKDNLMFNYCMILATSYYKQDIIFFPIRWSEEDQVSNVKMVNQAIIVLKMLGAYAIHKKRFIKSDLRDIKIEDYTAKEIYSK